MTEPRQGGKAAPESAPTTNAMPATEVTAASGTNAPTDVKYICPMPEHVSIQYDHPGKCSICGMTLVPVSEATLAKLHPGGKLLYFTCPMPEHSDVHSDKPGKCRKCGMTLIPVMEPPQVTASATNQAGTDKPQTSPKSLYTCPMASHADVVSDKPGKCTKCEMYLVPTSTVEHGKMSEANWQKQHAGKP